jgi:hypothetical protein
MALSNDGKILASAQCSIPIKNEEFQAKIIIWDTKTLRQKLYFHQAVYAIQSMAFSKYENLKNFNTTLFFSLIEMIVYLLQLVIIENQCLLFGLQLITLIYLIGKMNFHHLI